MGWALSDTCRRQPSYLISDTIRDGLGSDQIDNHKATKEQKYF